MPFGTRPSKRSAPKVPARDNQTSPSQHPRGSQRNEPDRQDQSEARHYPGADEERAQEPQVLRGQRPPALDGVGPGTLQQSPGGVAEKDSGQSTDQGPRECKSAKT